MKVRIETSADAVAAALSSLAEFYEAAARVLRGLRVTVKVTEAERSACVRVVKAVEVFDDLEWDDTFHLEVAASSATDDAA